MENYYLNYICEICGNSFWADPDNPRCSQDECSGHKVMLIQPENVPFDGMVTYFLETLARNTGTFIAPAGDDKNWRFVTFMNHPLERQEEYMEYTLYELLNKLYAYYYNISAGIYEEI